MVDLSSSVRGEEFKKIYLEMVMNDDLVVDVGASNSEAFFEGLASFEAGYDEVDLFVIPVVSGAKEQAESILTAKALRAMGVDKNKVVVVFNRVKRSVCEEFPEVLHAAEVVGFIADPRCMVFENDIYADLIDLKLNLQSACDDVAHRVDEIKSDLRKFSSDLDLYQTLVRKLNVAKKAGTTVSQLDDAFRALCGAL
ncbi:hypothetical protein BWR15_15570 [Pseudomonas sp. T]|nr:hypothetical protein BWR15_15570 [Pseudomonas sp. T]